ncbi:hypothetical protein C1646_774473, partial [Rhizophagus diaphanus]
MTKPRNNNKTKENNKSGKDTSGKRPASSSPAGNVSGQENTFSPPSGPINTTSVEQTFQTDTSSLDASLHAPNNDGDKGKSVEKTPVVSFPERATSPDASTAAVQSQPAKFYASAALMLLKASGTISLRTAMFHFRTKDDMEKATADLMDSLFRLHFHPYDPSAIKANENEPKLYRTAYITFELADAILRLDDTWAVLCGSHCLRICPASFSPDQRKKRCTYVALLASLPRGTIATDLAEIAYEVSAKSINVPFSMNSYNPKPYAYCHFTSQTAMDAAMEISCALKNVGLTSASKPPVNSNNDNRNNHSRSRSQRRPWNQHNVKPRQPDHEELDHYVEGMGIDQGSPYIPTINWTEI